MKKWILTIFSVMLCACAAQKPWIVPADLSKCDVSAIVDDAAAHKALGELLRHAELTLLDSDEERMAQLLRCALATGRLSDTETATAEWMLHDVCERNAPGSMAADFRFATPERSENRLLSFRQGEPLLLLFYDPDCRHCSEVMGQLAELKGLPTVLAVCVDATPKRWEQTRDVLPEEWVKAYDRTDVQGEDLYTIRVLPSLYLLDGERRVILKNPEISQLGK